MVSHVKLQIMSILGFLCQFSCQQLNVPVQLTRVWVIGFWNTYLRSKMANLALSAELEIWDYTLNTLTAITQILYIVSISLHPYLCTSIQIFYKINLVLGTTTHTMPIFDTTDQVFDAKKWILVQNDHFMRTIPGRSKHD